MRNKRSIALAILALTVALAAAANSVDLQFEHFEDGSGKVSWCLPYPLGDCNQ